MLAGIATGGVVLSTVRLAADLAHRLTAAVTYDMVSGPLRSPRSAVG
ncbi:hypothetical protein ACFVZJ_38945 [Streptomyces sp. NPDC058322]